MPESHWQECGDTYTLSWGGSSWLLRFDEAGPGLRCDDGRCSCSLLSLLGLAAPGRFEDRVFTPATLVGVERYRSRIQATFAPADWAGLIVRAAWSPSSGGAGVDLEVQASATSVGLLHDVEVMVQSRWERSGQPPNATGSERFVLPRDARSAALSYDGRESAVDLVSLVTLAISDSPRFHTVAVPGARDGISYVEMVCPDDVARFMWLKPSQSPSPETMVFTYGLFGHEFEKGVVFRARLRGRWADSRMGTDDTGELYRQFVNEPPPLGP